MEDFYLDKTWVDNNLALKRCWHLDKVTEDIAECNAETLRLSFMLVQSVGFF